MRKNILFIIIILVSFVDLITNIFFNKIVLLKYLMLLLSLIYLFVFDKRKIKMKSITLTAIYIIFLLSSYYSGGIKVWNLNGITIIYLLCYEFIMSLKTAKKQIDPLDDKKITILALHLGYGGIEQYISSLCKMLEKKYKIEIVSTYKVVEKPAFNFSKKVKIKYLIDDKPNKEEFIQSVKSKNIIKIIKEGIKSIILLYKKEEYNIESIESIDSKYIITTRDFHNNLVGLYGREDIIKIATEHNHHNNDKKYIKKVVNSVKNINYFILVSEELKDFYKEKVKAECIYIPNVLENMPKNTSSCHNHNLISIGRLSKEKGQYDLIDVIKLIKEEIKDIKLYLIGDGEERNKIKDYVKENDLEENVILTGFLSKKNIEEKILDSTVFVTTSYTESFGLAVLEACSYKLPVVAFDSAQGLKFLLENENGILVSNRDKEKMKVEIIKLLKSKKHREKISNNGYKNCQNYLLSNVEKKWIDILKRGKYEN